MKGATAVVAVVVVVVASGPFTSVGISAGMWSRLTTRTISRTRVIAKSHAPTNLPRRSSVPALPLPSSVGVTEPGAAGRLPLAPWLSAATLVTVLAS